MLLSAKSRNERNKHQQEAAPCRQNTDSVVKVLCLTNKSFCRVNVLKFRGYLHIVGSREKFKFLPKSVSSELGSWEMHMFWESQKTLMCQHFQCYHNFVQFGKVSLHSLSPSFPLYTEPPDFWKSNWVAIKTRVACIRATLTLCMIITNIEYHVFKSLLSPL